MNTLLRSMLVSAVLLGLFAVAGTGVVAFTHGITRERIEQNEREGLLRTLHTLVPAERHDNDLYADRVAVTAPEYLGTGDAVQVYRARKGGQPAAVVLKVVAPDGYSGNIHLLVAINYDGSVAGVRVVSHKETPGLGDKIEEARSPWIHSFDGRSLAAPAADKWKVKKDGGIYDQFTGATITPRAVVKAVYNTLRYFEANREAIFAAQPQAPEQAG